jgi:hypothetical protein
MFDAAKFFARRTADALRGRFGRDEVRKIFLQLLKFFENPVVFVVKNKLPAFDVISVVVPPDFVGKLRMALFCFGLCHARIVQRRARKEKHF